MKPKVHASIRDTLTSEEKALVDWKAEDLQRFVGDVPGMVSGLPGDDASNNPLVQLISPHLSWNPHRVREAYDAGQISLQELRRYEAQAGVKLGV